jgi:molybdopterin-containing oxidoreductase family membrane subunit
LCDYLPNGDQAVTTLATPLSDHPESASRASGRWLSGPRKIALWALWIALMAAGLAGVYQRVTGGHLPAGYGSYVPWGLWVAIYFHGVGIAGGVFLVAAAAYLMGVPGFTREKLRTAIVLSVAAMIPGLLAVWFDLGHMGRAYRIMTSPNFVSMMAFNAWMYNAFLACAGIVWLLSFKRESGWLKPVLCLGAMFAILFPSQSGAFFGVVTSKPFWHSPLLPMLFLASAVTAGASLLLVVLSMLGSAPGAQTDESGYDLKSLRNVVLAAMGVYYVFEFAEFSVSLWSPAGHSPAVDLILSGPYWWVFWIVHLLLGGLVPLVLLLTSCRGAWFIGALLMAVTLISGRLNVLIPGQAVSEINGLQEAFSHKRLNYIYHATAMEYQVGLFLVALGIAIFVIGFKINACLSRKTASDNPLEVKHAEQQ